MSVYVGPLCKATRTSQWPYETESIMTADTREELDRMIDKLTSYPWRFSLDKEGTLYRFPVTRRSQAVRYGAIETSAVQVVTICVDNMHRRSTALEASENVLAWKKKELK